MERTTQRVPAWRKIGQSVTNAMTAEEALKIGGLDYTVKVTESPVSVVVGEQVVSVENRFLTYGETPDGKLTGIGVIGDRYVPIQNRDAFDILNNIVDESGAHFDTAGTIGGMARCYISMKMPKNIVVGNGADAIETYLHCVNSHDGTSSFKIYVMFLRQICTNGLKGFRRGSEISFRHTINSTVKVQEVRHALQLVFQEQESFKKEVENLLSTKMTTPDFRNFVEELVPIAADASPRVENSATDLRAELNGLWNAPTQEIVKGTAWAAYNAVAEYVDWYSPTRGKDVDIRRAERAMGNQSPLLERAHALLTA